MLSKRITENRRLLTAAPAIKQRMMTRSRPRVLRPLACFRNWPSCAAAMVGKEKACCGKEGGGLLVAAASRNGARQLSWLQVSFARPIGVKYRRPLIYLSLPTHLPHQTSPRQIHTSISDTCDCSDYQSRKVYETKHCINT